MTVLLMCGSLQSRSANRAALDVAHRWLVERGVRVDEVDDLAAIDAFTPESVDVSPALDRFRAAIASAECVMIAAPEYAGGLSGAVKNALDWIVGSGELYAKAVLVMSAGLSGGEHALAQLVRTLTWQGALVLGELGIDSPRTKSDVEGAITDRSTIDAIVDLARIAFDAPTMTSADRLALAANTIARFGIDPGHLAPLS